MVISPTVKCTCTLQELVDIDKNSQPDKEAQSRWVLNTPEPPGLCHQAMEKIRDSFSPGKCFSSLKKQPPSPKTVFSFLIKMFPIYDSLQTYNATKFKDLMAGLTLATLSIPQSMGYAILAKLDPQYGLYTSIVPPLIYALMGTSKDMVIGAVAVDSLLLSSMIQPLIDPNLDSIAYTRLVLTATFFAGMFQFAFGFLRLGFLVDFLSHAAICGFMAGSAIVIGLQQMRGLFGITNFTNKTNIISVIEAVWRSLNSPSKWHPCDFYLGFSFLSFILVAKYLGKRNKKLFWLPPIAPLISVIVSSMIASRLNANSYRVQVLGEIKGSRLNPSSVHQLQLVSKFVGELAKTGLLVAVVALMEAIAVGRSFATIKGYHLDADKEMVSLGFMNIVGSFTSCYIATGSLSRTAVNYAAGAETVVSNIVMAITVLTSLLFFTRFLYCTPKAILASIILSALPGLIDLDKATKIWKIDKLDFLVCVGAFVGVLFTSVQIGLVVAVTMSFMKIILLSVQPGVEIVGRLPGTDTFCDVEQYPMATKIPGILIIRVQSAWLCFANSNFVRERILRLVNDRGRMDFAGKNDIQHVILDMSTLMNIDTTAIASLEELQRNLISHGLELAIANPRWQVIHKLKLADFVSKIEGRVFLTVAEAIDAIPSAKMVTI